MTDVSADAQRGSAPDLFCVQLVIFGLISPPRAPRHGRGKNIRSGESSGGRGGRGGGGGGGGGRGEKREDRKSGERREGIRSRVYKL